MSWKERLITGVDIILRVPPLFIMDAILNKTLFPSITSLENHSFHYFPEGFEVVLCNLFSFIGFLVALVLFLLSTLQLLKTYMWLISVGVIIMSIWSNNKLVLFYNQMNEDPLTDISSHSFTNYTSYFIKNGVFQLISAFLFTTTHCGSFIPKYLIYTSFISPVFDIHFPLQKEFSHYLPLLAAVLPFLQVILSLGYHLKDFIKSVTWAIFWCRNIIKHFGIEIFIEHEWTRLHISSVLCVFWIIRFTKQADFVIREDYFFKNQSLNSDKVSAIFENLLIHGSETIISIMGMTSIVFIISCYIGNIVQRFLSCEDEDKSIGAVSAILFFILALQTGLTRLEPEKRIIRLFRNTCLLLTAILHFIHNIVNGQLMTLGASNSTSLKKHSHALIVSFFLMFFPCWFVWYLWHHHAISTWLLAVTAFSIEVLIKTIISLLIYVLFLIDANRQTFWENLDDYIYYIRATGNTIAFVFGIFLLCNGGFILFFESGGVIRACMMCIHAYYNIWSQAKEGWKVFIQRRSAVKKINSLPEANSEQLQNFYDVCAICYQELTTARITQCNHYFHSVCLRKWLYIQDKCPLCHQILYF